MNDRTCEGCVMCCKLMGVMALGKPAGKWCDLVQIGGKGCTQYETRPDECRTFECLWLQAGRKVGPATMTLGPTMRPDLIKAVFSATMDGSRIAVYIDPKTPDHWRTHRAVATAIDKMRMATDVIVVAGDERILLQRTGLPSRHVPFRSAR